MLLTLQSVLSVTQHGTAPSIFVSACWTETLRIPADLAHANFFFTLRSHRVLPAMALLAALAPGFRPRKAAVAPLEAVRPDEARILLRLRRDPASRFTSATAGNAALAVEQGPEDQLLVHYSNVCGTLTIAGGWLGAGRRRYMWLPIRPTLAWNTPDGPRLTDAEIAELATDLHIGLDQLNLRHVLEEFHEPARIPAAERHEALDAYARFMLSHGWDVTYDETLSRRSLKRTNESENPERWSSADREALTRHEALVAEMLKGVRSSSRILYQTK